MLDFRKIYKQLHFILLNAPGNSAYCSVFWTMDCSHAKQLNIVRHSLNIKCYIPNLTDFNMWFGDHVNKQPFFTGFMFIQDIPATYVRHFFSYYSFGNSEKFVIPMKIPAVCLQVLCYFHWHFPLVSCLKICSELTDGKVIGSRLTIIQGSCTTSGTHSL